MIFVHSFLSILVLEVLVAGSFPPDPPIFFPPDTFCVPQGQVIEVFRKMDGQNVMLPDGNSYPGEIFIIVNIINIGGVIYSLTHKNNWWVKRIDIQHCNPVGPLEMLEFRNRFSNSRVSLTTYTAAVCMNLRRYPGDENYDLQIARNFLERLNDAIDINGLRSFYLLPFLYFTSQVVFESNSFEIWESYFVPGPSDPCTTTPNDRYDYKGRGPLKIEGRCDYINCDSDIDLDVENYFNRPSHIDYGFSTSMWKFLDRFVDIDVLESLSNEFWSDGLTENIKQFYDGLSEYMLNDWDGYEIAGRGNVEKRRFHFLHCTISAILLPGGVIDKSGCKAPFGCGNSTEGF